MAIIAPEFKRESPIHWQQYLLDDSVIQLLLKPYQAIIKKRNFYLSQKIESRKLISLLQECYRDRVQRVTCISASRHETHCDDLTITHLLDEAEMQKDLAGCGLGFDQRIMMQLEKKFHYPLRKILYRQFPFLKKPIIVNGVMRPVSVGEAICSGFSDVLEHVLFFYEMKEKRPAELFGRLFSCFSHCLILGRNEGNWKVFTA